MTDIRERVSELRGQGVRSIDIAHQLNVAQSTVHYHLRMLAAEPPAPRPSEGTRAHRCGSGLKTKHLVAQLLARGMTRTEVASRLGLAKSTVTYHARALGEHIDERFAKRFEWSVVQAYYDEGYSVRECARVFGFSTWSWHEAALRGEITPRPAFKPLEEIFAANTRRNRGHLKRRLLQSGLKDGSCERCGIREWLGEPLSTALHHINGDRLDNRTDNLELLCPNCHSQTENYGGRRRPGPATV